jgi:putative Mn2+ efflux pump MntP
MVSLVSTDRVHRLRRYETDRHVRQLRMPARIAGICGLVAFVTFNIGWIAGGLGQPAVYSFANDDISDVGAVTASSSWIQNRIGANLTGLLVVALALGLWRALSPDVLGRLGAAALLAVGAGLVLDGFFQLDCRGLDTGCTNDSWHSHAHKINSGITGAASIAAPLILAFAFRRIPAWRDSWLPSLITVPAIFLASFVFSAVGNGAGQRAADFVSILWIAFVGGRLLQKGDLPAAS